jgi:hypothetical protein
VGLKAFLKAACLPSPSLACGTAVIVCPGGAFCGLAIDHEGVDVAQWLSARGVAAFVLKYRLVPTPVRDEDFMSAWKTVLVFLIGKQDPTPLPAAVAHRAWVGRRRDFCTPD